MGTRRWPFLLTAGATSEVDDPHTLVHMSADDLFHATVILEPVERLRVTETRGQQVEGDRRQ